MIRGLIFLLLDFGGARAQLSSFPRGFERACLTKPCDDATFFKVCGNPTKIKAYCIIRLLKVLSRRLHKRWQYKRYAARSVSSLRRFYWKSQVSFFPNFPVLMFSRGGCPEVTKMISKYPELVNVIVRMSSSRGVSFCGSKHALAQLFVYSNVWQSERESCLRERLATKIRF